MWDLVDVSFFAFAAHFCRLSLVIFFVFLFSRRKTKQRTMSMEELQRNERLQQQHERLQQDQRLQEILEANMQGRRERLRNEVTRRSTSSKKRGKNREAYFQLAHALLDSGEQLDAELNAVCKAVLERGRDVLDRNDAVLELYSTALKLLETCKTWRMGIALEMHKALQERITALQEHNNAVLEHNSAVLYYDSAVLKIFKALEEQQAHRVSAVISVISKQHSLGQLQLAKNLLV
jgi:hypothetical protein